MYLRSSLNVDPFPVRVPVRLNLRQGVAEDRDPTSDFVGNSLHYYINADHAWLRTLISNVY